MKSWMGSPWRRRPFSKKKFSKAWFFWVGSAHCQAPVARMRGAISGGGLPDLEDAATPKSKIWNFAPTQPLTTDVTAAKHPRVHARHVNVNFPPHPTQPLSTDVAAAKHPRVHARHVNVNFPPHPTQPLSTDVAAAKHPRVHARHVNVNFPPTPPNP